MNIIGIGTDIVEIERIKKNKNPERFAEFFLLPEEISDMKKSKNICEFLASRMAAKEAVIKAYPGKIHYKDFKLFKKGNKIMAEFIRGKDKKIKVFLSISHEFKYAISCAVIGL